MTVLRIRDVKFSISALPKEAAASQRQPLFSTCCLNTEFTPACETSHNIPMGCALDNPSVPCYNEITISA